MRQKDILSLLNNVKENIEHIKLNYLKASDSDGIKIDLKLRVKACLENLRSCLDYCACDIYEKRIRPLNKNVYFPYAKTSVEFYKRVCRNFNKEFCSTNNDIYCLLESVQPYKSKNFWLVDLCDNTNIIKHNGLTEQEVSKEIAIADENTTFIKIAYGGKVIIRNNTFNGKTVNNIEINGNEVTTDTDLDKIGLRLIDWSTLKFVGSNIDILTLLQTAYDKITDLQSQLYLLL